MEKIGIFEARTKFPGHCDQVVRSGSPILISRRGKPLVVLSPASPSEATGRRGILDDCKAWEERESPEVNSDFPEVWTMRQDRESHLLED